MGRYYQFFLKSEVNKKDRGPLQWIQRDHIYFLVTKLRGNCKYISEFQGLRAKWDRILCSTRSEIYLQVSEKSLILNHVFLEKIQTADWSTEEAGAEGPSRICVGVFTPISTDQRSSTVLEVHNVEMDSLLNQPAHERSAIGENLCISYKITSTHDATKTLALLLAFLSNLVGCQPVQSARQANQPKLVQFLKRVIQKLVSTAGRN